MALRASAALPLLAGPPVELDGRLLRAAFESGRDATHAAFAPSAS